MLLNDYWQLSNCFTDKPADSDGELGWKGFIN